MELFSLLGEPFVIRALCAGIGISVIGGILGCFVVWRRMAYFSDSLSHSALLGIVLGLATGLNANLGIIFISFLFAITLLLLQNKRILTTDTLLGILAHSTLSVGVVTFSLLSLRLELHMYLLGDILTVTLNEIYIILTALVFSLILLIKNWSALIVVTIDEQLAKAEGINVVFVQVLIMMLMTLFVAISIRIFGILLITSILLIPAATAKQFAKNPENMAILSVLFCILSVIGGVFSSIYFDTPSSPTITVFATLLFLLLTPIALVRNK